MANSNLYQEIFDEIIKHVKISWDKLVIYLEYGNASYTFSFYVKTNNKYIKCYDLANVSDEELADSFDKIDDMVSKERNKQKELWTNMTMVVDHEGNMKTNFDYTDLSDGTYQFKKMWKRKYLI